MTEQQMEGAFAQLVVRADTHKDAGNIAQLVVRADAQDADNIAQLVRQSSSTPDAAEAPSPDAEGAPSGVVIGGVEHVTSGWAEYAANRRAARYTYGGGHPGLQYARRAGGTPQYIYAGDAVASLLEDRYGVTGGGAAATGAGHPLRIAAARLAEALAVEQDRLYARTCDADDDEFSVQPLTATEVREFAADTAAQTNWDDLADMERAIFEAAVARGLKLAPHAYHDPKHRPRSLPARAAPIDDAASVLALEKNVVEHAAEVEQLQTLVAKEMLQLAHQITKSDPGSAKK
jgi:hypothetical protein